MKRISGLLTALILLATSSQAWGQSAWVGGLFGLSIPNAENTTSRGTYGITGGAKIGSELGAGAYFLTSAKDEARGKFDYELYGVELAYHFEGEANGVYAGARLGTSKVTGSNVAAGTFSTSPMHYGAVVGLNKMLGENFSLGGEAAFFQVASANTTAGLATVSIPSFTTLNFMATAKLWF